MLISLFYEHNHVSGILLKKQMIGKVCINSNKHAEICCIEANKHKLKQRNYTIFSFRFNKQYKLLNAKPCMHCMFIIKQNKNIKNVLYSTNDSIIHEKVFQFITDHVSKKNKQINKNVTTM